MRTLSRVSGGASSSCTELGRRWGVIFATMSRPTDSLTLVFDVRTASGRSVSQVPVDNFLTITYQY